MFSYALTKIWLIAIIIGAAISSPLDTSVTAIRVGGEHSNVAEVVAGDRPEHNCEDIIKRQIVPLIDCSYSWENCGFDDHLEYQIKIDPVGDSSDKWCEMLNDKINTFTKKTTTWISCDRSYKASDIGNGIWLRVKIGYPWPAGGDFMNEVEAAIRFSMCFAHPVLTNWVNEGCYRSSICSSRYWALNERSIAESQPVKELSSKNTDAKAFDSISSSIATVTDSEPSTIYFQARDENKLAGNAVVSTSSDPGPSVVERNIKAVATPPPGIDPDFTCAFVDPNKGLSTKVDCSYYYEKRNDRLKYKVDIQPTSQDSTLWCEQLIHAIRQRCPHGNVDNRYLTKKCRTDVFESKLGKGMSIEFDALSWFVNDDNESCTEEAIKSTTCGIPAVFEKGGCYKA
ncbi:uncharacterized protein CTRU02_211675 [Colletotrichum truncatum]|uniref:Uncharacterized protein n=1 Tax=Colletotrichum truncatum TaxID=5467 RepID=A0ACC3YLI9_COLTU|nr:uncharacterized protein CTRU02_15497 [Colletotrichum truncatum]XP_036575419.1 uncharacterized protein CTRU02_14663 [Colletotrichum truncatum]KAF6780971.1 hypothetical protein CTRU02_15497 [Colletotrichum truncatum]KAF6781982.1 hypothetical protein CTRU02_14663 [Colletotrichum truncatum]